MKKFSLLILLLTAAASLYGQLPADTPPKGLQIGDKVPDILIKNVTDILIKNVTGYRAQTLRLSEFKDQLILLDFWATWCSSCVAAFPGDYALQQKYTGRFRVILVNSKTTRDTEPMITGFLKRREAQYHFPCVAADTQLTKLFPHRSLPHCVLIKNNKVLAITSAENITEENISALMGGKQPDIFEKHDKPFDLREPLFVNGNGGDTQPFLYRSMLLGHIPNLASVSGFVLATNHQVSAIRIYNGLLTSLYKFAYREYAAYPSTRIIFRTSKGRNPILDSAQTVGFDQVQFTYETNFSARTQPESLKILQADLDHYFNLKPDSEYRDTSCYVLRLQKDKSLPAPDPKLPAETNIYENSGASIYFTNLPVSDLTGALEALYHVPFLDETGIQGIICLNLPPDPSNEQALLRSLEAQGLSLKKEQRKLSFFILSEKPAGQPFH